MISALDDLHAERYTSPEGLILYTHINRKTPLVCVEICIQSGSLKESCPGEANLMLACLFKGSKSLSHRKFSHQLESLGGSLSLRCTPTTQYIRLEVLGLHLQAAFALIWEALHNPLFLVDEIEKEKNLLLSQLKNAEESSAYLAQNAFLKHIYGSSAQALLVDGTPEAIKKLCQEDLIRFHAQHYTLNNMVMSVSGHFSETIQTMIAPQSEQKGTPQSLCFPALKLPSPSAYQSHIQTPDKDQCVVLVGHLGIQRDSPDFMALMVLDVLLGQGPGFSSRLPQLLRDKRGLVYHLSFSATQNAHLYPGVMQTYLECSPDKVGQCLKLVQQELERVCIETVSEAELRTIQDYLQGQLYFCFETNAQRCSYFLHKHLFKWSTHHLSDYVEQLRSITPQALKTAAQKHFKLQAQTLITAGPEPTF
jgi:zinc protease